MYLFQFSERQNFWCAIPKIKLVLLFLISILLLLSLGKMLQDRSTLCDFYLLRHHADDLLIIILFCLIMAEQWLLHPDVHKALGVFIVLLSCRSFLHTIARDPELAIFVEMFDHVRKVIFKFFISYFSLFVGWVVAFHITMREYSRSFEDIGSSILKVLTMFTGELGFDNTFANSTNFYDSSAHENWHTTLWIFLLYLYFVCEMCIILMNLTIGLSISNIQVNYEHSFIFFTTRPSHKFSTLPNVVIMHL